ncbi:uncharacterized protein LOC123298467 [Chrysoperla carnea]|uniref:uncharacterized protein LOC123298467 n=1 Tax=Chrysoperla carnea TaxID=189513 RepID=UPI001D064087|nr:uncharacterized protein LOC123298467 [Chrysoperla carnea]
MNRNNRYSVNTPKSSNHSIITRKDSSELSKEDLNKLSVNDTLTEKDIRSLIYESDSEDNLCESDNEDVKKKRNKKTSDPLHKCGNDHISSDNNYQKCALNVDDQNESRKLSTNDKLKQIARENEMLTKKILAQQKPKKKINDIGITRVQSNAAVNRKKAQWSIDRTNQILYKKIQTAKPSGLSIRKGVTLGRNTKLTV